MNTTKKILAPLSGKIMTLKNVPDPVFAEKLTGDGLAIKAECNTVLAPCDGEITLFFDTKHAFAVTTPEGIQVLVHIGLNSIILNGEGLTALKQLGDKVKAGEPVLQIDCDLCQKRDIDMISPVLIVNHERTADLACTAENTPVTAGQDTIITYKTK